MINEISPRPSSPLITKISQPTPAWTRRISVFMTGITDAIHQLTLQTTRTIQFAASAIIDLDSNDLESSYHSFSIGLLQTVGLVVLAILGLYDPDLASKTMKHSFFRYHYGTYKFCSPTIGKILCVINAVTFFPCNLVLGVNSLIAAPFHDEPNEALKKSQVFFVKAVLDILAIPGGFFDEKLRECEWIQTSSEYR